MYKFYCIFLERILKFLEMKLIDFYSSFLFLEPLFLIWRLVSQRQLFPWGILNVKHFFQCPTEMPSSIVKCLPSFSLSLSLSLYLYFLNYFPDGKPSQTEEVMEAAEDEARGLLWSRVEVVGSHPIDTAVTTKQ